MDLWQPLEIEKERSYHWQIGPLKLWIQTFEKEWLLAFEQSADSDENTLIIKEPQEKPERLVWNRYVLNQETNIMQLVPAQYDRAVVVTSEFPVKILPGSGALFFVSIPVLVSVYAGQNSEARLSEIPTVVLSKTWFGDTMSGELCYSLSTKARRSLQNIDVSPHSVICPVQVKNASQAQLDFQKMCIHVEYLKIFRGINHLWTNEVKISFLGADQVSQIDVSEEAPKVDDGCTLLAEGRIPVDKSFLKKSIGILRHFTNF